METRRSCSPTIMLSHGHSKQIAATGISLLLPKNMRSAADIHNPILIMNLDGSTLHEVHLGWLHRWSPDSTWGAILRKTARWTSPERGPDIPNSSGTKDR